MRNAILSNDLKPLEDLAELSAANDPRPKMIPRLEMIPRPHMIPKMDRKWSPKWTQMIPQKYAE